MPTYTFAADKPTKGSGMGRLGRSRNKKGGNTITSSISKLDSHFQKSSLNQKVSDTQSLSYSASSSVAGKSRGSGASSDSSFADVMRVLEKNDAGEIAALMKREGVTDQTADEYVRKEMAPPGATAACQASSLSCSSSLRKSRIRLGVQPIGSLPFRTLPER